jgi:hypothetical protein
MLSANGTQGTLIAPSRLREPLSLPRRFHSKGRLLFELWTEQRYRPTRDVDFLARGHNAPERFVPFFENSAF